jgi:hypothetical protein
MRIKELLEGTVFKDEDFITPKDGGRKINFDLVDDLSHFMQTDDTVYRRFTHPAIIKFVGLRKNKQDPAGDVFKLAAESAYQHYIRKFPIRELSDNLEEDMCKQVCSKMKEEVLQHLTDGHYKD